MKRVRPIFLSTLVFVAILGLLVLVSQGSAVTWRSDARTPTTTVQTEESDKTPFAYYAAYTDNAITISYDGVEDHAYVTVTTEQDITAEAPDDETPDANFTTIDISNSSTPTLCGVVDAINGYTGYSATLVTGADCLLPAYDLATSADQEVTTSHTFAMTSASNLGISKVIPAAGTGKKIYINRIVCLATGTGAEAVTIYDGYSTTLWSEVLTNSTEKVIDFGTFGLVGSANTKMIIRVTGASTLTAGYIRVMGYTR